MQNAVLGNTAFLVGIEAVARLNSIDLLVTIRNNATFDRIPSKFWPGMTQVFVEFLPLENTDDADGTPVVLATPGNVTFIHKVWPKKVSYAAFTSAGGAPQPPVPQVSYEFASECVRWPSCIRWPS
jgi:hypothetical protein